MMLRFVPKEQCEESRSFAKHLLSAKEERSGEENGEQRGHDTCGYQGSLNAIGNQETLPKNEAFLLERRAIAVQGRLLVRVEFLAAGLAQVAVQHGIIFSGRFLAFRCRFRGLSLVDQFLLPRVAVVAPDAQADADEDEKNQEHHQDDVRARAFLFFLLLEAGHVITSS